MLGTDPKGRGEAADRRGNRGLFASYSDRELLEELQRAQAGAEDPDCDESWAVAYRAMRHEARRRGLDEKNITEKESA